MADFIKGLELCKGFFFDVAKPILNKRYPFLKYSAGLIGYGSDVLGYDDAVSRDHMWGPRFYLFLSPQDIAQKEKIFQTFAEEFPYQYKGYSVNFTEPNPKDLVQHPQSINEGAVNPLVFIQTLDEFLIDQLGTAALSELQPLDWLTFSEHRLLSIVAGTMFADGLGIADQILPLRYYPKDVKNYLIASNWDIIASEQAFVKRCGECGDEIGSLLICARIAERLMRLCFLYQETYAPYSKWFGTAFHHLDVDQNIKNLIEQSLHSQDLDLREDAIVKAQALVAALHNESGITKPVAYEVESYYGREIKVIFADKFAEATSKELKGTVLEHIPLIGSLSQVGGLSAISDDCRYRTNIRNLYV